MLPPSQSHVDSFFLVISFKPLTRDFRLRVGTPLPGIHVCWGCGSKAQGRGGSQEKSGSSPRTAASPHLLEGTPSWSSRLQSGPCRQGCSSQAGWHPSRWDPRPSFSAKTTGMLTQEEAKEILLSRCYPTAGVDLRLYRGTGTTWGTQALRSRQHQGSGWRGREEAGSGHGSPPDFSAEPPGPTQGACSGSG